jgi:molybdenum cofactor cytidylyltransferase
VKFAGMILAAGESSRMGRDKALLDYRGSTFLNHLISLFLPRLSPVVVVLGHHAQAIREAIAAGLPTGSADLRVVVNDRYRLGMLSSLQAGIRALPPSAPGALFTLVDHPAVRESTLDRLIEAFSHGDAPLVIPRYQAKRGHPVAASRAILAEILALPAEASAKDVIHAHRPQTRFLDVDDAGVITDVDSPPEYEDLKASW